MSVSSINSASYGSTGYKQEKQKPIIEVDSTQTKIKVDQAAKLLNQLLPEFSQNLSAKVINQGGQTFIEIRNNDSDVVIKRISDHEIAEFVESRKVGSGSLLDQYA